MNLRRRWPLVVAVIAVGSALVVVGALIAVFVLREDPGAKPLGEAVEEFRSDAGPPDTGPVGELRPEAGVYTARGEGRESISFPPVSQDDGAEMPATVVHEPDGCWTFTLDYNAAHWQSWRYCPSAAEGTILETGGQTYQRWDFGALTIENVSTFVCDPPVVAFDMTAEPGRVWDHSCDGTNTQTEGVTTSAGPTELVDVEELTIDREVVTAHHYRRTRDITGAQTGTETEDIWVAADSGLPLRAERRLRIDSPSPVGTITYDESGWWQLASRTPVR